MTYDYVLPYVSNGSFSPEALPCGFAQRPGLCHLLPHTVEDT